MITIAECGLMLLCREKKKKSVERINKYENSNDSSCLCFRIKMGNSDRQFTMFLAS